FSRICARPGRERRSADFGHMGRPAGVRRRALPNNGSRVRDFSRTLLGLAAALALLVPAETSAQSDNSTSIQIQKLAPDPGAGDILGIQSGEVHRHLAWQLGVYVNFADDVLEVRDARDNTFIRLVDSQTGFDLLGSLGLWDLVDIGLVLPLTAHRGRTELEALSIDPDSAGLGDFRVVPKLRFFGLGSHLRLAFSLPLSLPTGTGDFSSDEAITAEPTLIFDLYGDSGARIAANLGLRFRPERRLVNLRVGNELTYGIGARIPLGSMRGQLAVVSTITGSLVLAESNSEEMPLEWLAGLEYSGLGDFVLAVWAGPGLTRGYGTPDFRVVAGLTYQRRPKPPPLCPHGPEDIDGYADHDKCGDPDNDRDGLADDIDICPNEPETPNGFEDRDGCPDQDITDGASGAGAEPLPELTPARDNDNDGVSGEDDVCPDAAEDLDGFEDLDGCPDPDNDRDGITDARDGCPVEAEVVNGVEDQDGCPDQGKSSVAVTDRAIVILDNVYFETARATIKQRSYNLLDQVAATLRANQQISKLRIEGHTDNRGREAYNLTLSQARADSVQQYLIARGIERDRLVARGYGESRPIADNRKESGRSQNRRVEFRILEVDGRAVDADESDSSGAESPESSEPEPSPESPE
ncbi:MAG: OmpA family protein, partial [Proteobacteria bacterium]|nr:OmpA family protein [Pseudomonadota bacterium]